MPKSCFVPSRAILVLAVVSTISLISNARAQTDGVWGRIPSPTRTGHVGVWDGARDRLVVFGGNDSNGRDLADTWALSSGNPITWTQLAPGGPGPAARSGAVAVLDGTGNKMVVYGGTSGSVVFDDVWVLELESATWTQLAPSGTSPGGLHSASGIFDSSRNRMIVFGGKGTVLRNEAWALDLDSTPEWTLLTTGGTTPSARYLHTAIYQPLADRMIVYGGSTGDPATDVLGDLWSLSFAGTPTWEELSPVGDLPASRSGASAVYVPSVDGMYLFGGQNSTGWLSDAQLLTLGSGMPEWTVLVPFGPMRARHGHVAVLDTGRDRMLVMGGQHARASSETWAFGTVAGTWTEIDAIGRPPAPRWGHTMIYDPPRDRLIVFGGTDTIEMFADSWEFPLATDGPWKRMSVQGTPPAGRTFHSAIYDPVGDRMIVYGGYNGGLSPLGDVWALEFGNFDTWTQLLPTGSPPLPRRWHSAVYNDRDHRMTIYGGENGGAMLGDVRELDLATTSWTAPTTPPGPLPADRCCHEALFVPVERTMMIFGGWTGVAELADTWELPFAPPGGSWSEILASGVIAPRTDHSAVFDWMRNRMLAFGGVTGVNRRNDVSQLSFDEMPAWSPVTPAGTPPYARSDHPAVYDPIRDRMLVFGGFAGNTLMYDDLWTLTWGGNTAIDVLCPASLVFTPGDTVHLDVGIMNPFLAWIPYEYRFTSERDWPGAAASGVIDAKNPLQKLTHPILAPDSAAVGNNTIGLRVWVRDAPHLTDTCTCILREITTPVLVSLVAAEASPDQVRLAWHSAGDPGDFVLSRSRRGEGWVEIARPVADGRGRVEYVDRDVVPGRRYGYHLARDGAVIASTEVWVDVPEAAAFGLHQIRYQGGAFQIDLSLTGSGPARLEILDTTGRRVASLDLSSSAGMRRRFALPSDLPAGIYFARLLEGGRQATARALVLR